ncbi:MAG TPA: ATP-binding cassette domain-containing protein [Victivallales bacterium]|nr:ATP-binding cassette domain-containing protein [Victivallales bacterium]
MIRFESVSKSLSGREVLKNFSLNIEKGSAHTILGPTGSGKTVTLRHIVKLLEPDDGCIKFDGVDISSFNGKDLELYRTKFGYLFQSGALIAWMNVADNVALPLREKTKMGEVEISRRVSEVLELVGMGGTEGKMPDELSGGMRKRAGLARAIVIQPEVILFDEPTSGLDPIMSRKIDDVIRDLKSVLGVTVVMVTHDLISAFSLSDRISMIFEGQIVFDGTVPEFESSENGLIRDFIAAQVPKVTKQY